MGVLQCLSQNEGPVHLLAVVGVTLASEAEFLNFARTFNKKYATLDEFEMRQKIFVDRYESMIAHNQRYEAGEVSWWRKVTQHYDLTTEEMEKALGLGGALPASQADQIDIKEKIWSLRLKPRKHPSLGVGLNRVELPLSKTRDNVEAAQILPPLPPLTPVCGRHLEFWRTTCQSSILWIVDMMDRP